MHLAPYILSWSLIALTSAYPASLYLEQPKLTFKSKYQLSQPQILHETKTVVESHHELHAQHVLQNLVIVSGDGKGDGGERGVVSKYSRGDITMYARKIDESVKMAFEFALAGEATGGTIVGKGAEWAKLELRSRMKRVEGGRDAAIPWLISHLAESLASRYPNGLGYLDDTLPHTVKASGVVSSRDLRYKADMDISITYVDEESQLLKAIEEEDDLRKEDMTDKDEWSMLLGLWKAAALVLKRDVLGEGKNFEELRLVGEIYGIMFEVGWKFEEDCLDS